jgi:hypothetical protein
MSTGWSRRQADELVGPFLNQVERIHSGTRASRTIPRLPRVYLEESDTRISVVCSELVAREKSGFCIEVDKPVDE